jgi:hypothetical protein
MEIVYKTINSRNQVIMSVTDLVERIEKAFEDRPKGQKRKELAEWKLSVNLLIEEVNKLSKIKMYKPQ